MIVPASKGSGSAPLRVAMTDRLSFVFAVLAVLSARGAAAAEIGQCLPPAAMTAALKAEDQHSIVTADILTPDKTMRGVIVTMSGDRKTGYILKADRPLGEPANRLCVHTRLADLRLFDARQPGLDPAALLKAPDADAARRCAALEASGKVYKGGCVPLNAALRRMEGDGDRVVLQGLTVAKKPGGGTAPDGTLTTLSGNVTGGVNTDPDHPAAGIVGEIMYSSLPDGATVINETLVYVRYTPYGLSLLN